MGIGGLEWVLIVMAILLLFGAKRIPELARGLGQGIKEFRKASDDIRKEIDRGQRDIMESTKFDTGSERREDREEKHSTVKEDTAGESARTPETAPEKNSTDASETTSESETDSKSGTATNPEKDQK